MEIWKDIKNYEGHYQISNYGRVKRLARTEIRKIRVEQKYSLKEMIMNPGYNSTGYLRFDLYKNSKIKRYFAHRLVAEHFIPNPNNLPEVNHIDGNKENNHFTNLEWSTTSDNQKHAIKNGLVNHESFSKKVVQIDKSTNEILKTFKSIAEAERVTNISHIGAVCRGKRKTAGGYKWKYLEE